MISRRGFLGVILATGVAPAIAKYPVMRVRPVDAWVGLDVSSVTLGQTRTLDITRLRDDMQDLGEITCEVDFGNVNYAERLQQIGVKEPQQVITGLTLIHKNDTVSMSATLFDPDTNAYSRVVQLVDRRVGDRPANFKRREELWNYPITRCLNQRSSLKLEALPSGAVMVQADGNTLLRIL